MEQEQLEHIRKAIGSVTFRFAKTMPEIPHEYFVLSAETNEAYWTLVNAIREHGVDGMFGNHRYRYLLPGDGWRYWCIPPVLNRARLEDDEIREKVQRERERAQSERKGDDGGNLTGRNQRWRRCL